MDTKTFDRLTARWATHRSRRGALTLLGGGALASVLAAVTPEAAEACPHRRRCGRRKGVLRCCPHGTVCHHGGCTKR